MMIRWISSIVLIVTFLAVQDVGYGEDDQLCQPDIVVMFGNGVWNDAEDANESRRRLQKRLEPHVTGTDLEGKISYNTAHNPTAGTLLVFLDFFETFVQGAESNYTKFWRFLAGLDLMPDILQDKFKEISSWVDSAVVSINPSVQEHTEKYDAYLREGNVVVLVAHSQGNLYGNIAYGGIDPKYRDGFGIVSVANPDSFVAGGGPYTTIDEDYVISPLQFLPPFFALYPNLDNFFGPVNLADWSGHKFIDSYMAAGHDAETVILDNVVNMINDLSSLNPNCVFDHFDDNKLDPIWQITFSDTDGWNYSKSGTLLTVTDIPSTVLNRGSGGTWGRVFLSRPAPALDNFEAEFHIEWDSESQVQAMQNLIIRIYDENGGLITGGGYSDGWVSRAAAKVGFTGSSSFSTPYDSLPLSGSAAIKITRENNFVIFYWDSEEMVTGTSFGRAGRVEIEFSHYAFDNWDGISFFGNESVDLISLRPLSLP